MVLSYLDGPKQSANCTLCRDNITVSCLDSGVVVPTSKIVTTWQVFDTMGGRLQFKCYDTFGAHQQMYILYSCGYNLSTAVSWMRAGNTVWNVVSDTRHWFDVQCLNFSGKWIENIILVVHYAFESSFLIGSFVDSMLGSRSAAYLDAECNALKYTSEIRCFMEGDKGCLELRSV